MTARAPKKPATSLRSDEPDKLARGHLVEVIGNHILHANAPESVVILNAPWGAGKSSFLNLLEQKLVPPKKETTEVTVEQDSTPIIVCFNPWHYTNVDQLVRMFFSELARGIGAAAREELGKKIGDLLRVAGSLAAVFSSGAGGLLKDARAALKDEKRLPELKRELDKLLPDLAQRVVVFIDDIDRLERDALRLLFRMIRLNADFPNVTYVLAFDRLVVERNLDEENGIRGRDDLEKIIQVSFDIPEPEPSTTHRILFAEMDAVLESLKTRPLDQHRWGNVFHSGFKEHFRTIRHIKRYANGLRLTLAPVAEEVDLVDFLIVELLRVFHPEVYVEVVNGKDMLAPMRLGHRDGVPVDRLKKWVEDLSAKASTGFDRSVLDLLRQIFLELARVYSNTTYGDGFHAQWRRERRVCAPEVFDKFFLLAIPEGEISEVEMQAFVDQVGDRDATKAYLQRAMDSGKARRLLERIEDFTKDIAVEHIPELVAVLFDEGDKLRFESRGFLDVTADMQVPRIIYQCLSRLPSERERSTMLFDRVKSGAGLYTVIQEVSLSEPKDREVEGRLISDRALWEPLRDAAVERIRAADSSGDLWTIHRLPYLLFAWLRWADEAEVKAAVARRVADGDALLALVGAFVDKSHSHTIGDKVARKHVRLSKKGLGTFLDLEATADRLRAMSGNGATGEIASGLLALLEQTGAGATAWPRLGEGGRIVVADPERREAGRRRCSRSPSGPSSSSSSTYSSWSWTA